MSNSINASDGRDSRQAFNDASFYVQLHWLDVLMLISVSFADITFGLPGTETSPWPLLLGVVLLALRGQLFIGPFLWFVVGLLVSVFGAFFYEVDYAAFLKSALSYLQLIVVGVYFYHNWSTGFIRWARVIIYIHLAVGFLQALGLTANVGFIFDFLLNRVSASADMHSGRGVSFLGVEPSHVLQSIVFPIFLLGVSLERKDRVLSLIALFASVILSSAGVSILYVIVLIVVYVYYRPHSTLIYALFALPLASNFFYGRGAEIIRIAVLFITNPLDPVLDLIVGMSGFRIPTVISGIESLFHFPSILSYGAWERVSLENLTRSGFDYYTLGHWAYVGVGESVRPYSVFANICTDFWWFGAIIFVRFLYRSSIAVIPVLHDDDGYLMSFFVLSLFALLFMGTFGKPAFVAIIGVCLSVAYRFFTEPLIPSDAKQS